MKLLQHATLVFLGLGCPARSDEDLFISPVIQETDVWCWAAVTEMVFDHFGVENASPVGDFQCAIVGAAGWMSGAPACFYDCSYCVVTAGSASNLVRIMEGYSNVASQYLGHSVKPVDVRHRDYPLPWDDLVDEIDSGNPVIAGISPGATISMTGASQHVALIVGYEDDGSMLLVNDPFPFDLAGWAGQDPYVEAGGDYVEMGQYWVNYDTFLDSLNWGESFIVRASE